MRRAAIILNLVLLLNTLYLVAMVRIEKGSLWFVLLGLAAPIASLGMLSRGGDNSWLGLYIKRKILEEQQKIAKLEGADTGPQDQQRHH
jgi:hypothetical protein